MDDKGQLGYRLGPAAEFVQEVGQVIINYSECERAIFHIFQAVMRLSEEDAYLLVKYANVNSDKMVAMITAKIGQVRPELLAEPLQQSLNEFKRLTQNRNILAHWQWAVTDGDQGLAFNAIKGKPAEAYKGQPFELAELKSIAWKMARTATMLNTLGLGIRPSCSLTQTPGDWRQCYYPSKVDEVLLQHALEQTAAQIDEVENSMFPSSQASSVDKAQRP